MEYQLEQEKNNLKARELQLKEQIEQNKLYLTNKEMEMQAQLKAAQIDKTPDKNTSLAPFNDNNAGNISSGFVKEFWPESFFNCRQSFLRLLFLYLIL